MALDDAGVQLIAAGVAAYVSDINKADDTTTGFYKTLGSSDKSASSFQQVITGALRQVGAALVEFGVQGAKAIGGFVKDSIGLAGDFESGMLSFQAVAGKDVDTKGLEQFRDLFLDIGKRLPVSTSEVQQAAIEMVKGGIDPAIIAAGGLERNIQFAAAAMDGDLVKAAEISSKILGGWADVNASAADKTAFLAHSQDILSKAANASATDVEGLSRGIFQSQGIAKTAGVQFDDLVTTLAELAPRFASSAEAGTSLKNLIARLQPTTKPAIAAMEGLGLITEDGKNKFYDASGAFIGFQQASQLLQGSLKGLNEQQQAQVLQTIFGNDAMSAAAALAELGAAGYQHMSDSLAAANGVTDTAALKQQGFNTALDNAKGSVETLQIQIGTFLLPILTDLLNNYIAPGVNAITAFAESFMKMAPAIAASDDPLQTFLNALKVAAPGLLDIITQIEHAKDAFVAFVTPIEATVMPVMQQLATFIGDNLKPILFGIGVVIASVVVPALASAAVAFVAASAPIVALIAAGALLYKAWTEDFGGIRTTVTAWWEQTLQPAFEQAEQWLAKEIPQAVATMSAYWTDTLLPAMKKVGSFFEGTIFPILGDLADVWIALAIKEIGLLEAIWSDVLWPALKIVGSYINDVLLPIFKGLFEVEWAIAMKAGEALAGLWQKVIQPALKTVGEYINSTVLPAFQGIGSYLNATFGPALSEATKWLDKVTGGFGGVTGAVKEVIKFLGNAADAINNLKLPPWLTPGSPTPLELGLLGIGRAIQGVVPGLSAMGMGMKEVGAQITDAFVSTDIVDMLTSLGEDAMAGFGAGLRAGWRGVKSIIDSTANSVEDAFKGALDANSPAQRMVPIGQWVIQGIIQGMQDQLPALSAFVGSFGDDLTSQMQDIADQVQGVIADAFGATASIDRQVASNLDKMKDVLPQYQQYTRGALDAAQAEAQQFADPAQGAKYFALRSKQILEYAKLQKDLADATSQEDKDRISQQMLLINQAQQAELSQFRANQQGQTTPQQAIGSQINSIIAALSHFNLTDDQIHMVDALATLLGQITQPQSNPYANPTTTMPSVTNNTQNVNMPVYTNQSPSVLRDSMAIMGASMP